MSQSLACLKHESVLPYITDMAHTYAMAVHLCSSWSDYTITLVHADSSKR